MLLRVSLRKLRRLPLLGLPWLAVMATEYVPVAPFGAILYCAEYVPSVAVVTIVLYARLPAVSVI